MRIILIIVLASFSSCAIKGNKEIYELKKTYGKIYKRGVDRVEFNQLVIFSCDNIPNSRYLLNENRTDLCWIENPSDVTALIKGVGGNYIGSDTVFVQGCPEALTFYKPCDPSKLRNF